MEDVASDTSSNEDTDMSGSALIRIQSEPTKEAHHHHSGNEAAGDSSGKELVVYSDPLLQLARHEAAISVGNDNANEDRPLIVEFSWDVNWAWSVI